MHQKYIYTINRDIESRNSVLHLNHVVAAKCDFYILCKNVFKVKQQKRPHLIKSGIL